jgi:hypothetical protein
MNDPMFVEVARALGAAALSSPGDDAARLDDLGRRVLSRPFAAAEREALLGFLSTQRQRLAAEGREELHDVPLVPERPGSAWLAGQCPLCGGGLMVRDREGVRAERWSCSGTGHEDQGLPFG